VTTFALDLKRFEEKAVAKQQQALRKISIELFGRVIMRTPVDTGRLRGNWQATTFVPATSEVNVLDKGSKTNSRGIGNSIAKGSMQETILAEGNPVMFHLTNTLPYAKVIEYGDPVKSKQAPAGMVRVSIIEFRDVVEEVVNAL